MMIEALAILSLVMCAAAGVVSSQRHRRTVKNVLALLRQARKQRDDIVSENELLRSSLEESLQASRTVLDETGGVTDRLRAEVANEKRKARELFDVVETVLKERDQWKTMWFDHGREHLEAQTQLENTIVQLRGWLKSALSAVNAYRVKEDRPRIQFGDDPKDPPIGTAYRFEQMLEQAKKDAPPSVDGLAMRDAVVSISEVQP